MINTVDTQTDRVGTSNGDDSTHADPQAAAVTRAEREVTIDPTEALDWDWPPDDGDLDPDDAASPRLVERVLLRVTNLFLVRSGSDSLEFSGHGGWMTDGDRPQLAAWRRLTLLMR